MFVNPLYDHTPQNIVSPHLQHPNDRYPLISLHVFGGQKVSFMLQIVLFQPVLLNLFEIPPGADSNHVCVIHSEQSA